MRLKKIQNYLKKCQMEYNYRVLDGLGWITIIDKLNNFVRIDEINKKTIRLTFQNMQQNIIFTNVFKTQEEILKTFNIKDSILIIDKNVMKK